MGSNYLIFDNFLSDWEGFRKYLVNEADFSAQKGKDGVEYPDICLDIPENVRGEIEEKLKNLGAEKIHYCFARMSLSGVKAPHFAHSDAEWGKYSLMLYMNDLEDCEGGTAFVRHQSGFSRHPINQKQLDAWNEDCNSPDMWDRVDICEMYPNRACIFESGLMHQAEPIGGFVRNRESGRMVLTVFFS